MALKKVVRHFGTGHCPKCGNSGFNYTSRMIGARTRMRPSNVPRRLDGFAV